MKIDEQKIKALMERRGISSQVELARRCKLNYVALNRAIRGKQSYFVSSGTVVRLCQVLQAQPGEFLYCELAPAV